MGQVYSINNLKSMEIIDINTGTKLGFIKDLKIDVENYKILALTIPDSKGSKFFSKNDDIEIKWDKIKKIGVDVILIDGDNLFDNRD
ncbi:YlmC/YmxH family sporulation protein [Clostridium hydrogenum]|uniref:YlmC/YmxH family sporulation protein n=1 Tax=Clostridium hydrogenum TaxID=2855764 RepID=UPI002E319108|nr:YlmC/YmxH family sporulation protein [Clostridium hydrogenum]